MDANLKTFSEARDGFLVIPKFQRGYEWDEPEWEQLWKTVFRAYLEDVTAANDSRDSRPVFMGAIVRQHIESDGYRRQLASAKGGTKLPIWAVIDGQQRLLSLLVFMAAVRDFYYSPHAHAGPAGNAYHKLSSRFFFFETTRSSTTEEPLKFQAQDKNQEAFLRMCRPKELATAEACLAADDSLSRFYKFVLQRLATPVDRQYEYFVDSDSNNFGQPAGTNAEAGLDEDAAQLASTELRSVEPSSIVLQKDREWESERLLDPDTLEGIVDHLKFAAVDIEDDDKSLAYDIFETLNARGKPLELTDMFRNGFFLLNPDRSDETYEKFWLPMEESHASFRSKLQSLKDFFFNEAIRQFGWTDKSSTYPRLMESLRQHQEKVNLSATPVSKRQKEVALRRTNEELAVLRKASDAYLTISRGQGFATFHAKLHEKHFDFLRRMDIAPAMPILMQLWMLAEGTDEGLADIELQRAMVAFEGLLVRRLVAGVRAQQLRSLTSDWARQMRVAAGEADANARLTAAVDKLISTVSGVGPDRYPDDRRVMQSTSVPIYSEVGAKKQIFYLLWELNRELDHDARQIPRPAGFGGSGSMRWTIEHVLPQWNQSASKEGERESMPPAWKQHWIDCGVADPEQKAMELQHTIGNLIPLRGSLNSSVRALPFAEKKAKYVSKGGTRLAVSEWVMQQDEWLPDEIVEHSTLRLANVCQRWPDVRTSP